MSSRRSVIQDRVLRFAWQGFHILPMIELLRSYFRIASDDDLRTLREIVTGRVVTLDRTLQDALPYLFSLLTISESDDGLVQIDGQIRNDAPLTRSNALSCARRSNGPLVMIIEDRIDEQTQEFVNLLAD